VSADSQSKQLLSTSTSDPSSTSATAGAASVESFELTKDDQGKFFMCESVQVSTFKTFSSSSLEK
jgi:hypothetical protein